MIMTKEEHTDERTIARIVTANNQLDDDFKDFFLEVEDNQEFIKGDILGANNKAKLAKERRPAFETRLYRPILAQIYGSFKNKFPGIDFLGVTPDDHEKASLFKAMNDYILHQKNDTRYEMSKSLLNSMIGRIGWIRQDFSFADDEQGMVEIKYYTGKLKFDPNTERRDMSDCKYMSDEAYLSDDDLIAIYAHNDPELEDLLRERIKDNEGEEKRTWVDKINDAAKSLFTTSSNLRHSKWEEKGKYLVIDWYERRRERTMTLYNRVTRESFDITEKIKIKGKEQDRDWYSKEKLAAEIKKNSLPVEGMEGTLTGPFTEEGFKSVIYQTSICPALNLKLYEAPQQLQNGNFKFTPLLGYDYSPKLIDSQCVVDDIKDLIKSWNMRDNTNLTLLMKSTHGGYIVEEKAKVKGIENLKSNEIGGITYVPNGTLNKILPKAMPTMSPAIAQFQDRQLDTVKFVSSSTDNARGISESSAESGKLFNARVNQSNTTQEGLNDNAQWVVKQITKNNIFFIQTLMTQERIIRVTTDVDDVEFMTVNAKIINEIQNDLSIGKYDVTTTVQPIGQSGLDEERTNLIDIVNAISQIGKSALPSIKILLKEIIKKTALSNKTKILESFDPEVDPQIQAQQQQIAQQQEQLNQLMMQLEATNKDLTNEELKAKIEDIKAKTIKTIEEAKKVSREMDNMESHKTLDGLLTQLQRVG